MRWHRDDATLIAMDAPPPHGRLPSVRARRARCCAQPDVHAPRVLAQDLERGFLLLTDLGATHVPRAPSTRDDAQ